MMATAAQITSELDGQRQQFQEQIDFFRAKLNLPTQAWDDIWQAAHDRAFIVAGAQKADLLADLRAAVDKAITGGSIGDFRKDFEAAVTRSGWSGWTGQGTKAGEAWRTRVIYQTNVATSYAAGRWAQLNDPDLVKVRPFWRYIHADGVMHPRPLHKAWGDSGLTLPRDHPFWKTNFPPNGWGCGCRVKAVRGPAADDATAPPEGWDAVDPKTGAPAGIDKGWGYAPGANADAPLRQLVQDKLITYPDAIGSALTKDVNRYISAKGRPAEFAQRVLADKQLKPPLWLGFVEDDKAISALVETDVKGFLVLLPADAPRHVDKAHRFDGNGQRPATPTDYNFVAATLNDADTVMAGKTVNGMKRVVATKRFGSETFEAIFEVRPSDSNKALSLITLVIKTK